MIDLEARAQEERLAEAVECLIQRGVCFDDFWQVVSNINGQTMAAVQQYWERKRCGRPCTACPKVCSTFNGGACPGGQCPKPIQPCPPETIPDGQGHCIPHIGPGPAKCPDGTPVPPSGVCAQPGPPPGPGPLPRCKAKPQSDTFQAFWSNLDYANRFCTWAASSSSPTLQQLCSFWRSYAQGAGCFEDIFLAACNIMTELLQVQSQASVISDFFPLLLQAMKAICDSFKPTPTDCPSGTTWDGTACICPPGQKYVNGKCTSGGGGGVTPTSKDCTSPAVWDNAALACVCPNDQVYDKDLGCTNPYHPDTPWDCVVCDYQETEQDKEFCQWLLDVGCPSDPNLPECIGMAEWCQEGTCFQSAASAFDCLCCDGSEGPPELCTWLVSACTADPNADPQCPDLFATCVQRGYKGPNPYDKPQPAPFCGGPNQLLVGTDCYECPAGGKPYLGPDNTTVLCPTDNGGGGTLCAETDGQTVYKGQCVSCPPGQWIHKPADGSQPICVECDSSDSSWYDKSTGSCVECQGWNQILLFQDGICCADEWDVALGLITSCSDLGAEKPCVDCPGDATTSGDPGAGQTSLSLLP